RNLGKLANVRSDGALDVVRLRRRQRGKLLVLVEEVGCKALANAAQAWPNGLGGKEETPELRGNIRICNRSGQSQLLEESWIEEGKITVDEAAVRDGRPLRECHAAD